MPIPVVRRQAPQICDSGDFDELGILPDYRTAHFEHPIK
jgi:hypothetical protein